MGKPIKKTDQKKAWARRTMNKSYSDKEKNAKKVVFHIICEGVNTEPAYFNSFPLSNAYVESFGLGQTKTKLVESVLKYKKDFFKDLIEPEKRDYIFWVGF